MVLEAVQVLAGLAAGDGAAEWLVCGLHQGGRHGGRAGAAPVWRRELLGQLAVVQGVSRAQSMWEIVEGIADAQIPCKTCQQVGACITECRGSDRRPSRNSADQIGQRDFKHDPQTCRKSIRQKTNGFLNYVLLSKPACSRRVDSTRKATQLLCIR